ncbi:MAG: 2-oxo acid dehydrogenase subunit E2 [Xanthomonadales bacterium]|nr:2-oxo acid dehydrogenase subunit E2 [Gammaproteobacteria bacterium]MBT8053921.1 2-oxo acid dehydrogenase subunit E2 [Gammaproteobacteria bacterium]NND58262.1 2-oxo acid dehydrogenase subunit E2 [Xanthomonadales bacterium]NNK52027.1 2-oxo acid dehydrogenase subunit E2 [Xanthomonadales bacterium]
MSEFTFKLPDLGEGTVEAEIAEWMVHVGDTVEEEDPICAMLTDKAAVELTAPVSGTVKSVAGQEGDMVAVGSPLIVFETSAEAANEAEKSKSPEPSAAAAEAPEPAVSTGAKVMTSPSIRAKARAAGIDLSQLKGSGPRGRILKKDLESFIAQGSTGTVPPAVSSTPSQPKTGTTEIKVIGLRRKIAERMAQSAREIPHFTYVEEVDVTALESLRDHLNSKRSSDEPKLTPLAFLGMAMVRVLADFPQCNAHYDKDRNVIIRHDAVHLGVATQTDDGLKVPVVRHCETLGLEQLAAEIRRVSGAARDNTATREELSGSTITVTSLGKMGGVVSTPVINQPEVGIVGVNKSVDRPVVINGQVVVRRMMNLSSSFDHRFVDGYDGAAMILALKDLLEQPATIFMP